MKDLVLVVVRMILHSLFEIVIVWVLLANAHLGIKVCGLLAAGSFILKMAPVYQQTLRLQIIERKIFVFDLVPGWGLMMVAAILAMITGYLVEALVFGAHAFVTFFLIKEMYKFKKDISTKGLQDADKV